MVTDTLLFIYAEAHREATESGKRMSGNSTGVLFSLGFIINLKKSVLNSEDRISGFSDRLTENDDLIATAEDQFLKQRAIHLSHVAQVFVPG